jgi:hypothetical protein
MRKIQRIWIGALIAVAALVAVPAAGALAAPVSHATTSSAKAPRGNPAGCGTAHFCSYKNGNGGNICYNTPNSIASWSTACRTVDTVYNNGAAAAVRLYWGTNYTDAWYCLGNGDYLLHMTQNTFNQGSGKPGYQQPMANHVKSSRLGGACS